MQSPNLPQVLIVILVAILGVCSSAQPAQTQVWPHKPVRIIVPFGPGGNTDGIARITAQRLGETFAQSFIVENRPGAGGALAAETVARSQPDGYTLFLSAMSMLAILPAMTKTPYDPVADFAPISNIGANPLVLITHPSLPAQSVGEFVTYVRAQPQKLSYVAAYGSVSHLAMAVFVKRAGLEMIPVNYRGGAAPMTDVLAGHVPTYFAPLSDVLPHRASGALRVLAVSSEKRIPQLPDVPTLNEAGFPGFRALTWNGLLAPAGTPKEIVDRIAHEIAVAMKDSKFVDRLVAFGIEPLGNGSSEFTAMIAADTRFWAEAVKIAGVQSQ